MTTILAKPSASRNHQTPPARCTLCMSVLLAVLRERVKTLRRRYWREAFLAQLDDIAAGTDPEVTDAASLAARLRELARDIVTVRDEDTRRLAAQLSASAAEVRDHLARRYLLDDIEELLEYQGADVPDARVFEVRIVASAAVSTVTQLQLARDERRRARSSKAHAGAMLGLPQTTTLELTEVM